MFPSEIIQRAEQVIKSYAHGNRKIVTAESCTGGLIASALTEISGSSDIVERGFVTYSNEAKHEVLGVIPELFDSVGAVSIEVAEAMAKGAIVFSHADVAVSTTGIAGPTGATPDKPVGLVFIGLATRDGLCMHYRCQFSGNRTAIRLQATEEALRLLLSFGIK